MEYDPDEIHLNPEHAKLDSMKRLVLSQMGCKVATVTNPILKDRSSMDRLACSLTRVLGVHLRPRARNYDQRRGVDQRASSAFRPQRHATRMRPLA